MTLTTILLQAAASATEKPTSLMDQWGGMLMIIAMIVIFYFFMIRPQSKKQKEIKKAREAMGKGDKVVTAGGIFGSIKSINDADNTIMMEVAPGVTIKVSREQIFPVVAEEPKKEK